MKPTTKLARLINSFFYPKSDKRKGFCEPTQCETLTGVKGGACCRLCYKCMFLNWEKNCNNYSLRPRNCRVFPRTKEDLKKVS